MPPMRGINCIHGSLNVYLCSLFHYDCAPFSRSMSGRDNGPPGRQQSTIFLCSSIYAARYLSISGSLVCSTVAGFVLSTSHDDIVTISVLYCCILFHLAVLRMILIQCFPLFNKFYSKLIATATTVRMSGQQSYAYFICHIIHIFMYIVLRHTQFEPNRSL